MRKKFTWLLSLMVTIGFLGIFSHGYAQETQKTVELYAEEASACYNGSNEYFVKISVRDFIKITEFDWVLEYNANLFTYVSATADVAGFPIPTHTENAGVGVLTFAWTGGPLTVGDDVKTDVLTLKFSLDGFPNNIRNSFFSDLEWTTSDFHITPAAGGNQIVKTDNSYDGSLSVNVLYTGLTENDYTLQDAACYGSNVNLTITNPAGSNIEYSFNNGAPGSWTSNPTASVVAPSTVTVRVRNTETGCYSHASTITIDAPTPLTFSGVSTTDAPCFGENGSVLFSFSGGTAPYDFYVLPESQVSAVLALRTNSGEAAAMAELQAYKYSNFNVMVPAGTYYVAVVANNCQNLFHFDGVWALSNAWWSAPVVIDQPDAFTFDFYTTDVIGTSASPIPCYGDNTGAINVSSAGLTGSYSASIDGGATWVSVVSEDVPVVNEFEDLSAGTYTVWVKNDVTGCMISKEYTVYQAAPVTFDIVVQDTKCGGANDGIITVSNVQGGTGTIEYSKDGTTWQASNVFENLSPTYYSIYVRRGTTDCIYEYSNPNGTGNVIAVQSPDDISFDVNVTNPLCFGGNATVTVTNVKGGNGTGYQYSLNGGAFQTTTTFTVAKGTEGYPALSVTVQNLGGTNACPVTKPGPDITEPGQLQASVDLNAVVPPNCYDGSDGYFPLVISGGTKPYYYSINNGSWVETNLNLTLVSATVSSNGGHVIAVKDKNNCAAANVIVPVSQDENKIAATPDPSKILCYDAKTAKINVTFSSWAGGLNTGVPVRNVIYKYSTSAATVFATGIVFNPASDTFKAGTYYVGVVDELGCTSNVVTVSITQNPELKNMLATKVDAECFGTFSGSITINVDGGTPFTGGKLKYAVSNTQQGIINTTNWYDMGAQSLTSPYKSSVTFQAERGKYYLAVKDDCGKIVYGEVEVDGWDPLVLDPTKVVDGTIACFGETTQLDATGAVTGGSGNYVYTLQSSSDNGSTYTNVTGKVNVTNPVFANLAAGYYKVIATDIEGCPFTGNNFVTKQLTQPTKVEFTIVKKNMSCYGSNDGIITITASGGTPDYWYAVNNKSQWFPFGTEQTVKTYLATEPGTFTIWVKDKNNCESASQAVTITQPALVVPTITVNNHVTCSGGSDGQITVSATGGWNVTGGPVSTFLYQINDTEGSWSSATVHPGLPAGTHTLYVKAVLVPNGHADYQPHGDHCVVAKEFTITEPAPISYNVTVADVKCKDGSDGTLTVNVLGGGTPFIGTTTGGYEVRLIGSGAGFPTAWIKTGNDLTHTFSGLAHGLYEVQIRDSKGCGLKPTEGNTQAPYFTIESWEVNEPATYLTVTAEWKNDVTCFDGPDGKFLIHADGGTPPYKYWAGLSEEPDGHILVPNHPAETSSEWKTSNEFVVGAGTWVVWAMDSKGCIVGGEYDDMGVPVNEWRVKVEEPAKVTLGTLVKADVTCYGTPTGQILIHQNQVSGGSETGYKFVVSGTTYSGQAVQDTFVVAVDTEDGYYKLTGLYASYKDASTTEGSVDRYNVKVLDSNDCASDVKSIAVKQPKALVVTLEKGTNDFTCADAIDGYIHATVTGGVPYDGGTYHYRLWKNGAPHSAWVNGISSFFVQIGNAYAVEVRDKNECISVATIDIDPIEPVLITDIKDLTCFDESVPRVKITATGEPGRTFWVQYQKRVGGQPDGSPSAWIPFSEANSHVISTGLTYGDVNDADGHYRFWVKDDKGCISEEMDATFVKVQHALAFTHTVTQGECTSEVTFNINGGIAPYEIWIDGVMMEDGLVPNTPVTLTLDASEEAYSVVVRDAHECLTVAAELLIEANPVTDEVTVETYFDEEVHYVNEAYEVDEMLDAEGSPYTFEFTTEEGCLRVLTVTVVEVYKEVAISEIQGTGADSPLAGMKRAITGTVTGVVAGQGYFVQDASEAWSGIWVADAATTVAVGDGVYVEGTVSEVNGVTTLTGTGEKLTAAPVAITAVVLASPELAKDEKYESVLVQVKGVRAAAADGDGKWEVFTTNDKRETVNKWFFTYAPVSGNFYDVTGIVDGRAANYYLNPRMASDIRDITATTDISVIEAADFKVYPNPFNNELYIDNHNKLTRVSVTNIAGQRVMDVQYPERVIRTANLVSGVYVITLFTEEGIVKSERIVKR